MSKHTPGPWHTRIAVNGTGDFGIVTPDGDVLAEAFSDIRSQNERSPDVVYNARLIAAAPDLLESIQELIAAQNAEGRPAGGFSLKPATREHQRRVFLAWQRIHAAIAKATGGEA